MTNTPQEPNRNYFKLWYPGINGEGSLEDTVFRGMESCFDTDHKRVPNEPDNPVVVKVDGKFLAANEHSLQNSDFYEETGAMKLCNDIAIRAYVGWLGDHLEIGTIKYEGSSHECQATGSWLSVSMSDEDALTARKKFFEIIADPDERTGLHLKGFNYCTDEADELIHELANEIDAGTGSAEPTGDLELIVRMLASYEANDAEYLDGELLKEFFESTDCYEGIPGDISNLDAGLFMLHTDDPNNAYSKGVFKPHRKAVEETFEEALRERMGNNAYNECKVTIEAAIGEGSNLRICVYDQNDKRVYDGDGNYSNMMYDVTPFCDRIASRFSRDGWSVNKDVWTKTMDGGMGGNVGRAELVRGVEGYACSFESNDGNSYAIAINPQPDNIIDALRIADLQLTEEGIA